MKSIFRDSLMSLKEFKTKTISISTTSKEAFDFKVLPLRSNDSLGIASFMINDSNILKELLLFFDGKVDIIFVDVERKQDTNLFEKTKSYIKYSKLIPIKPNDNTLESCDLLIRNQFNDDLINKNVIVIGTGNLASKIALRLSERQCNVFIRGRNIEKTTKIINGLNLFLPKYNTRIKNCNQLENNQKVDVIVSFISGPFDAETTLLPYIDKNSFIIDGGINNFSSDFVNQMLHMNVKITRLDTRIALPYQLLSSNNYVDSFFNEIYGQKKINDIVVVSGGYIGSNGSVIVDNIKQPNQIIGIADGSGGVKKDEQLTKEDRQSIQTIREAVSTID